MEEYDKEEYNKEEYIRAISEHVPWIKDRIDETIDGIIRTKIGDIKKEMGPEFEKKTDNAIFRGIRFALFDDDLIVTKGRHKDGEMLLIFRMRTPDDKPPMNPLIEEIEIVPGINEIKEMYSFNEFRVDIVVETVEIHKDIIKEVDVIDEDSIDIYLRLDASKQVLIKGIIEIINKFRADTVEYGEQDDNVILGFWWD